MGTFFTYKRITPESVYVSFLTKRRTRNAEGWERMETVSKKPAPTGSFILDEIARMLAANVGIDAGRIARRLGASEQDVQGFFRILTGMNATDFIGAYRILRAKEWLTCTDLPIGEIHGRCGFSSHSSFTRRFDQVVGCSPLRYRAQNRPANYRDLYRYDSGE